MNIGLNYRDGNVISRLQQKQVGLLSRVFLLTALFFMFSAAIMYGVMEYVTYHAYINYFGGMLLGFVVILLSNIFFFACQYNIPNRSVKVSAIYLTSFTILLSVGVGILLGFLNILGRGILIERLPFIFLITGLSSLVMGLFGLKMSDRAAATLGRFLFVGFIAMFIFGLALSLIYYFAVSEPRGYLNFIYFLLGGVLSLGTVAFTVNNIKRSEEFLVAGNECSSTYLNNLAIMFTAMLINSLIWLVWYLANLVLRSR